MRRIHPKRGWALGVLAAAAALALTGAGNSSKKPRHDPPPPKADETVSNLAYIARGEAIRVEGVGLVSGLDNTGVEPGPGYYKEKLLDEMKKANVENPNKILTDPRFTMVIVRGKIPSGLSTKDHFDVEIELPPGSGTSSLGGGYLMETRLRQVMIAGGSPRDGKDMAIAHGPIVLGTAEKPNSLKVGRVLGGGWPKKETPFSLVLKENRRSVKTALLLERRINSRFHQLEGVEDKGMAKGLQTDQLLILRVPRAYHHFPERYFEVVKLVPIVDSPQLCEQRLATQGKRLLQPETTAAAALSLEAIGPNSADVLKTGLTSPDAHVRFFSAEALAYLNNPAGVEVLSDAAIRSKEFQGVALNALAALDHPAAHVTLRKLMSVPQIALRYGAFNALRTLDPNDPFLGRVRVLDEPPADPDEEEMDSMAVSITRAYHRRNRPEDPFQLYLVDSEGPPMVHVASTKRSEIVIFGREQRLLTPIVLGTGPLQLNASDGDVKLQISKIVAGKAGTDDEKIASTLELGEVIRQTANMGATYPDVLAILEGAARQRNLPGPLVVNAIPVVTAEYLEAVAHGKAVSSKKDKALQRSSGEKAGSRWKGLFNLNLFNRD